MASTSNSNADRLVRSTAKILAMRDETQIGTGSGVLMMLHSRRPGDDRVAPALVTNRHVVEWADVVRFGLPHVSQHRSVAAHAPLTGVVFHPDPTVDLCVIPVHERLIRAQPRLHVAEFISSRDVWDAERLDTLTAIERIVMIGYPDGLQDQEDLHPISRQGITATPAFAKLDGRPDFMIDCACFPGSSGSPVFLFDQGVHVDKNNELQTGTTRFGLLGFLYAGPVMGGDGSLVSAQPPAKLSDMKDNPLMMNLGICLRAELLLPLIDQIAT